MTTETTTEAKPESNAAKLKHINAAAKVLRAEQKELRKTLNASKGERIEANKTKATARKGVSEAKSELRKLTAKTYATFSKGTTDDVKALGTDIETAAENLVEAISQFAEASETLDNL